MTYICLSCGAELPKPKTHFCNRTCQSRHRRQQKTITKICEHCGTEYRTSHERQRFCSPSCASAANMTGRTGEHSNSWRGGLTYHYKGYVYEYCPKHYRADSRGYVLQHILRAEEKLGRLLWPWEVVHHRDGDKRNNDPDNLEVFWSTVEHSREEARLRRVSG